MIYVERDNDLMKSGIFKRALGIRAVLAEGMKSNGSDF